MLDHTGMDKLYRVHLYGNIIENIFVWMKKNAVYYMYEKLILYFYGGNVTVTLHKNINFS